MRRRQVASLAIGLLLAVGLAAPAAAQEPAGNVTCSARATVSLLPALRLIGSALDVSFNGTGDLFGCVDASAEPDGNRVLTGLATGTGRVDGNCLHAAGNGTVTITWILDTGANDTSTLSLSGDQAATAGAVITGQVIAGRFLGYTVATTGLDNTVAQALDQCGDGGLSRITGTGVVTLVRPPTS